MSERSILERETRHNKEEKERFRREVFPTVSNHPSTYQKKRD